MSVSEPETRRAGDPGNRSTGEPPFPGSPALRFGHTLLTWPMPPARIPAMPGKPKSKKCPKCGEKFDGDGELCLPCHSTGDTAAARVAAAVKERIESDDTGTGPVCPFCRSEITWENVGTIETEVTIYVREKIYYCPKCRAFLGVSSWHSEG